MPCSEKRARIHRLAPLVIRLVDRRLADSAVQQLALRPDPGSRFTGMALARECRKRVLVLSLLKLAHRARPSARRWSSERASAVAAAARTCAIAHRPGRRAGEVRHAGDAKPEVDILPGLSLRSQLAGMPGTPTALGGVRRVVASVGSCC